MALAQDAITGAHEPGHPAVRLQPDAQFVVEKSSTPLAQSADAVHNNEEVSNHEKDDLLKSNALTREATSSEIRFRVEYVTLRSREVLMTRESTEEEQVYAHTGYVFDVVNVNYTSESNDTRKNKDSSRDDDDNRADASDQKKIPDVEWRGRPYIRVYSRAIINALQSVVNYYPGQGLVSEPIDIYWPYSVVVHHRAELLQFLRDFQSPVSDFDQATCCVKETSRHLQLLLDFVENKVGDKVRELQEQLERDVPVVSFDTLWLLLKPGVDVYERYEVDASTQPHVVNKVDFVRLLDDSWSEYQVTIWALDNDESGLRPVIQEKTISRFHGERPIHELDLFPCRFLPTHEARQQQLIDRGKLFADLQQKKCMYFEGESIEEPRQSYRGYVMVDPVEALKEMPREDEMLYPLVEQKPSKMPLCSCQRCLPIVCERNKPAKFSGYKRISRKDLTSMTDHQYFICAFASEAFVLPSRRWVPLRLEGFSEPRWKVDLMDSLVLKEEHKEMLVRLCQLYVNQRAISVVPTSSTGSDTRPHARPWTADYIDSKGKGLVVLLHGKPGVGKTYTAECIAHSLKRPLLSISCADIGVAPPEVEKNLRKWFALARAWDAVLLIDEADIYFESRETMDLERNNLVASFLRVIEYHDGILFLTTNRIGTSDEAMWSRIHATIYYDDFKSEARRKIWDTYFRKLKEDRGKEIAVSEEAREFIESPKMEEANWNGREIRNAFQIAVNLAQAEDSRDAKGRFVVERKHIKVTVDLLKEFKAYMHGLHKKTNEQRALEAKIRFDPYNSAHSSQGAV